MEPFEISVIKEEKISNKLSWGRYAWNTLLFHEAMRNLNWSRDYLWYAELDGVPNPFQRNGVIGLPLTDVTFVVNDGESFTWNGSIEEFSVPKSKRLCDINITFIDDEQETMFTFFERWFNNIYNNNIGVLPLTECCKTLSLYKLKSTRNKVTRTIQSYDYSRENREYSNLRDVGSYSNINDGITARLSKKTEESRDFLVYPDGPLQEQSTYSGGGGPREYSVRLVVADYQNADYGNPAYHESSNSIFSKFNNNSGSDFLSKIADYI